MRNQRRRCAAVLVTVAALVAAGCGDDEDTSPSTGAEGTQAGSTAASTAITTAPSGTTSPSASTAPSTTGTAPASTDAGSTAPPATVEPQTIKIGFAYADLAQFADVNPAFTIGDPEEQIQAVFDKLRADGDVPVNGVDIELVIRKFSVLESDEQLSVCQAFAEEDEVFAVLGSREFNAGAECLVSRYQIPVINTNPFPTASYDQIGPSLFTMRIDEGTITREFVAWATEQGLMEGKKIGLVVDPRSAETNEILKTAIEEAGFEIVSEVENDSSGVGGENDQVVAQRLQADGADLVLFTVGSTTVGNIMLASDSLGYTPDYLDWEVQSHLGDVASGSLSVEQYGGTRGLGTSRVGDSFDGEVAPVSEECLANYEAFSGKTLDRQTAPRETGEFETVLMTCDLASVFVEGLRAATTSGSELTAESMIAGLETIEGLEGANWDSIGFTADDHSGADSVQDVVFDGECKCFSSENEFRPLTVR